jgi:uncharacterized protein DUF1254/adenylate/guanylate cyclase family protein
MEEMGHRSQGAKGLIAPCDVSWPCWLTAPLASIVKDGGFGKYVHHRELYPVDAPIVRPNRDTLYSFSNFDLDAGPVTITLPDARQRTRFSRDANHPIPDHSSPAGTSGCSMKPKCRSRRYEDVAVLFCDVANFTAYCDKHEPEDVVSRLDEVVAADDPK